MSIVWKTTLRMSLTVNLGRSLVIALDRTQASIYHESHALIWFDHLSGSAEKIGPALYGFFP
jgi:hypothetical protein